MMVLMSLADRNAHNVSLVWQHPPDQKSLVLKSCGKIVEGKIKPSLKNIRDAEKHS